MPLDDSATTHHQPGRVDAKTAKSGRCLAHQHALIGAAGAGQIPQTLDRVHAANLAPIPRSRPGEVGFTWGRALPLHLVASNVALDINLTTIGGEQRPLSEWVTTFHLASVVLDPYTNESSWVLSTATRILDAFRGADVRVNLVLTCGADDATKFLGPLADDFMVFCDADRSFVRGLALNTLPAFVFVKANGDVVARAEGWVPSEWRDVAKAIADNTWWTAPIIPLPGDPSAFHGTPAQG